MGSEIMNAVTIYEINGMKYNGPRTINVTSHPRFLNFVRLCIDNREYSLGADDLMRAVDRVIGQPLAPEHSHSRAVDRGGSGLAGGGYRRLVRRLFG